MLVGAYDVEGWAAGMSELLADPARRDRLGDLGYQRAGEFTWDRSVRALATAYEVALSDLGLGPGLSGANR